MLASFVGDSQTFENANAATLKGLEYARVKKLHGPLKHPVYGLRQDSADLTRTSTGLRQDSADLDKQRLCYSY